MFLLRTSLRLLQPNLIRTLSLVAATSRPELGIVRRKTITSYYKEYIPAGFEGFLGRHIRGNMVDILYGGDFVPPCKRTKAAPVTKTANDLMLATHFDMDN